MNTYSVLIPVHNESDTIGDILDSVMESETPELFAQEDVVVVASGCTDSTIEIVRGYDEVTLIEEESRNGKSAAIREGLEKISSDIVVLSSGDLRWEDGTLDALLEPFRDEAVGVATSRPIPNDDISGVTRLYNQSVWDIHHYLSKRQPKAGELIAFRNVIRNIPEKCVADEEYIAQSLEQEYEKVYAMDAVVQNFPPDSFAQLYRQRRRVFLGHLDLLSKEGYCAPSVRNGLLFRSLWEYMRKEGYDWRLALVAGVELICRGDAVLRYLVNGEKPYIWEQVE
ncbi:MAG: glycosyltransferase [Candidatus Nanohaloarchaea archaeon]|nr:glycosyltransferase [Candidatus Nanohaloarchaea archaeon]